MPVKGSPIFNTIMPSLHCTSPWPANAVSRQPVRVLPSNMGRQPSPSKGADGFADASSRMEFVASRAACVALDGCCTLDDDLEDCSGANLQPARSTSGSKSHV